MISFHPLKAGRRPAACRRAASAAASCFHPLKAGRRLRRHNRRNLTHKSFHPLKAGRRRLTPPSFPPALRWFPSPQGGSETQRRGTLSDKGRRFPSPQGGSETTAWMDETEAFVEFPSPQGGSETFCGQNGAKLDGKSFHPLKAGRRPRGNEGKGGQKGAKGREGCRRPSVGGKS